MIRPRRAVERMAPYSPPSSGRAGKLRLDFNENTLGASPRVVEAIERYLSAGALTLYPEYAGTKPVLARFFGVAEEEFLITNGTDEAIQVLVNTFVDAGQEVIVLHPSYAMYRFYAEVAGAAVRELRYREGTLEFPLEELIDAITPATRAVLLSNPNNPTGAVVDMAGIERVLAASPETAVLIDEAYFEFHGVTALGLIRQYPNLFVSRTFSKVYGMAAMRVGCLFSHSANIGWMEKAHSPYSVNMLAAVAVQAAVEDQEAVRAYVAETLRARPECYEGLERLGIGYWKSEGNFVLFRSPKPAAELCAALGAKGILVRNRSHEIAETVRVTIGSRDEVRRFLNELEALL